MIGERGIWYSLTGGSADSCLCCDLRQFCCDLSQLNKICLQMKLSTFSTTADGIRFS